MSGANTNVIINIGARVGEALRGLDKVDEAFGKQGEVTSKWQKGVSTSMKVAGAAIAAGAAAAAAALVVVGKELIEMGREAVENEKSASILANTLSNVGFSDKQIEKNEAWIRSMRLSTLVVKDELRLAVADLAVATGDLSEAQDLATIAWDAAVATGKGYEEIVEALVEAQNGETGALVEQFQWLELNEDGTISLSDAMRQLERRTKGAAKEAAKNDPWTRLRAIWEELRIALGNFLLPLVEKFGEWFADPKNQKKVEEFIDKVAKLSREIGVKAVEALEKFYEWLQSPEGQQALKDVKALVEAVGDAVETVAENLPTMKSAFKVATAVMYLDLWKWRAWLWVLERIGDALEYIKNNKSLGNLGKGLLPRTVLSAPAVAPRVTQSASNVATRFVSAPQPAQGSAPASNATINIMTNDPFRAGAVVKRMLEGNDVVQGRPRGRPLALAW